MRSPEYYMRLAIREGRKGLGRTSPNPPVGAVVVDPGSGRIIAKGFHRRAGAPHAEAEALEKAGEKAKGAHLFVTLEPCTHRGRTPPCTEAILKAGIKKVWVGTRDPNPLARGGKEVLEGKGVEVVCGVLEKECRLLARFFLKSVLKGLPWVILKVAASLDGKVATRTGDSKWITSEEARAHGHRLRDLCDAILVGRNTVEQDDPELTCRLPKGRSPVRVILDSNLSLSPGHKVFQTARKVPTWVFCRKGAERERAEELKRLGVEVFEVKTGEGGLDLEEVLKRLCERGVLSVLVEGGSEVWGSFVDASLVDEVFFYYGWTIIGGTNALCAIRGRGAGRLSEALKVSVLETKRLGTTLLVRGLTERGLEVVEGGA